MIQKKMEKDYISLLADFIEDCGFYFSYEYDITHTAQRISQMSLEEKAKPLWERVCPPHSLISFCTFFSFLIL
jgi:hypothetical protein